MKLNSANERMHKEMSRLHCASSVDDFNHVKAG
jgi:hypothetical protein